MAKHNSPNATLKGKLHKAGYRPMRITNEKKQRVYAMWWKGQRLEFPTLQAITAFLRQEKAIQW
jgi:hypothetical protein